MAYEKYIATVKPEEVEQNKKNLAYAYFYIAFSEQQAILIKQKSILQNHTVRSYQSGCCKTEQSFKFIKKKIGRNSDFFFAFINLLFSSSQKVCFSMQMPDNFLNISLNTGFRFQIIDIADQLMIFLKESVFQNCLLPKDFLYAFLQLRMNRNTSV
jgi:hypothetical protein